MFNRDKIKGFITGVCVAAMLCSTTVFADSVAKTVTAVYNNIKIVIDGTEITPKDANGNKVEPFIIDGTTYLPVRAIADAFGKEVNWDGNTNTVYLGEMPVLNETYTINSDILKTFSDKTLATIGNNNISGGIFNFYMTQNVVDDYLKMVSDNYSPDATLQTLTIDNVPASKYITDEILTSIKSMYAVYDDAEKSGFTKKQENINEVNSSWDETIMQMGGKEAFEVYAMANSVSIKDLEDMVKKSLFASLYVNSLMKEKMNESTNTLGAEASFRKNYITAKHILVSDESLAKEIIAKLDKGGDFDALMKEHNTDPGATAEGYTFTYGEMVIPFETAAFNLKENTYTASPVKTDYGYHIIYRCPLNEKAISSAIEEEKYSKANEYVAKKIASIEEKVNVTTTEDFQAYINSIK